MSQTRSKLEQLEDILPGIRDFVTVQLASESLSPKTDSARRMFVAELEKLSSRDDRPKLPPLRADSKLQSGKSTDDVPDPDGYVHLIPTDGYIEGDTYADGDFTTLSTDQPDGGIYDEVVERSTLSSKPPQQIAQTPTASPTTTDGESSKLSSTTDQQQTAGTLRPKIAPRMTGNLLQYGGTIRSRTQRFCVLEETKLRCYHSQKNMKLEQTFELAGYDVSLQKTTEGNGNMSCALRLFKKGREQFWLYAVTETDAERWFAELQRAADPSKCDSRSLPTSPVEPGSPSSPTECPNTGLTPDNQRAMMTITEDERTVPVSSGQKKTLLRRLTKKEQNNGSATSRSDKRTSRILRIADRVPKPWRKKKQSSEEEGKKRIELPNVEESGNLLVCVDVTSSAGPQYYNKYCIVKEGKLLINSDEDDDVTEHVLDLNETDVITTDDQTSAGQSMIVLQCNDNVIHLKTNDAKQRDRWMSTLEQKCRSVGSSESTAAAAAAAVHLDDDVDDDGEHYLDMKKSCQSPTEEYEDCDFPGSQHSGRPSITTQAEVSAEDDRDLYENADDTTAGSSQRRRLHIGAATGEGGTVLTGPASSDNAARSTEDDDKEEYCEPNIQPGEQLPCEDDSGQDIYEEITPDSNRVVRSSAGVESSVVRVST